MKPFNEYMLELEWSKAKNINTAQGMYEHLMPELKACKETLTLMKRQHDCGMIKLPYKVLQQLKRIEIE